MKRPLGTMSRVAAMLSVVASALLYSGLALAQDYPSRPIKFIVPYAAGGIADLLARSVAHELGPRLGQTIVIENRTGAGGHLGADTAVKAPADGYTLVLATIAHNAAHSLYANLVYNPEKDLKPVILLAESAGVLVVHESVKAKSVQEFIALAKAGAGLNYGSAGHGSAIHLAAELFKFMTGTDIAHVPYRGSAPAMNDLLGGQINAMFENIPTALPHIQSGKIRALGVTGPKRSPSLADTPTIAEAGVPGYQAVPWYTISVATAVPAEVVAKLNGEINAVLKQEGLVARWNELGLTVLGGSPEDAAQRNAAETLRWSEVIKQAKLKAE
jgi:tripartite-type tricarboxylate transporter receptor subunit TctC